jgi:RNA recognition motif-containing protein
VRLIVGAFGSIRDIYQPRYFGSTKPRGVIFVEMVNEDEARRLVEETNVFYDNEHVRIEYAGPRGRPGDFIGRAVAKAVAEVGVNPSQPIIVNINYGSGGSGAVGNAHKRYNFNVHAEEWTSPAPQAPPSTPIMTAETPRTPERPKPAVVAPPAPTKVRRPPPGLDIMDGIPQRIAIGPIEGVGFNRRNLWGNKLGLHIPPFDLPPGQDDTIWPADPDYKPRSTGLNV